MAASRSRTPRNYDPIEVSQQAPLGFGGIAEILKEVIRGEGLAKKADLERLGERLQKQEERQDDLSERIAKLEKLLARMSEEMGADRTERKEEAQVQATSYASMAARAAVAAQIQSSASPTEWTPTLLHISGFAPCKCSPDEKLPRDEFRHEVERLLSILPSTLAKRLAPCAPVAISHQLAFRLRAADIGDMREVVSEVNKCMSEQNFRVRSKACRAATEIYPDRRILFRNVHSAVESLCAKGVARTRFDMCAHTLRTGVPGLQLLGSTNATTKACVWEQDSLVWLASRMLTYLERKQECEPHAILIRAASFALSRGTSRISPRMAWLPS